jgi:hypothetical protein
VVPVSSEAADKRRVNKTLRRVAKESIRVDDGSRSTPILREVSDPWNMAKEGKSRIHPAKDQKQMRK